MSIKLIMHSSNAHIPAHTQPNGKDAGERRALYNKANARWARHMFSDRGSPQKNRLGGLNWSAGIQS